MSEDCDRTMVELSEFLDGEQTIADAQQLTSHLQLCPRCADGFLALRATVRLARWSMATAGPAARIEARLLADRILAAI
jgi:anti-sigma factor RsiW